MTISLWGVGFLVSNEGKLLPWPDIVLNAILEYWIQIMDVDRKLVTTKGDVIFCHIDKPFL